MTSASGKTSEYSFSPEVSVASSDRGEHQELPGQQCQPGREYQGVEQRGHVPPAATGPDQLQQGHRDQ
jgi:hypothetical protein